MSQSDQHVTGAQEPLNLIPLNEVIEILRKRFDPFEPNQNVDLMEVMCWVALDELQVYDPKRKELVSWGAHTRSAKVGPEDDDRKVLRGLQFGFRQLLFNPEDVKNFLPALGRWMTYEQLTHRWKNSEPRDPEEDVVKLLVDLARVGVEPMKDGEMFFPHEFGPHLNRDYRVERFPPFLNLYSPTKGLTVDDPEEAMYQGWQVAYAEFTCFDGDSFEELLAPEEPVRPKEELPDLVHLGRTDDIYYLLFDVVKDCVSRKVRPSPAYAMRAIIEADHDREVIMETRNDNTQILVSLRRGQTWLNIGHIRNRLNNLFKAQSREIRNLPRTDR